MNSKPVIFICPPNITDHTTDWVTGEYPIQSDVSYHIVTSFHEYGRSPFFVPEWLHYEKRISLNLDSVDECFEKAKQKSNSIVFLFAWNVEPLCAPRTTEILHKIEGYRKQGYHIEIVCVIPDAWYREKNYFSLTNTTVQVDYITFIEEYLKVCDRIVTLYEGTKPYLEHKGRSDLSQKIVYVPSLPMVMNYSKFENKSLDFCYIGLIRPSRSAFINKVKGSFPSHRFYVTVKGKYSKQNNPLQTTKQYLDKVGDAVYSIMGSSKSAYHHDGFDFPGVMPARLGESIISNTIPIYHQDNNKDCLPKFFGELTPCIYISIDDDMKTIKEKIENVDHDRIKSDMREVYEKFISPKVVIPQILY